MRTQAWIVAGLVGAATAAGACPNPLVRQRMTPRTVEQAELALGEGRYRRAFTLTDSPMADDPGLYRRALVIHMTSALRRGYDAWTPDNHSSGRDIVKTMKKLATEVPDDPWLKARLAEALASTPAGEAEAKTIFEELAAKDLLPDPSSWGALGQLRTRAGDAAGGAQAAERCRAAAKAPVVCTPLREPQRADAR